MPFEISRSRPVVDRQLRSERREPDFCVWLDLLTRRNGETSMGNIALELAMGAEHWNIALEGSHGGGIDIWYSVISYEPLLSWLAETKML